MQITAIILAGGKSTRMGTDKALIEINDKSLLENAIDLCKPISSSILISSNFEEHKKYSYEVIPDEIPDCGPIGGIYSCLKETETEWNFVLSVDSPFVELEFIRNLISEIDNTNAIVPIHSRGKEPLIALYHKNSLSEIEKRIKSGNYKMYDLVDTLSTKFVDSKKWLEKYPNLFHNINRPEDLV